MLKFFPRNIYQIRKHQKYLILSVFIIIGSLCSACTPKSIEPISATHTEFPTFTSTAVAANALENTLSPTSPFTEVPGSITPKSVSITPTQKAVVQLSSTPDIRPLPADWMDWPYMPTISKSAIEIYKKGIENGTEPTHFSVVGDCQSIPFVFLGVYDRKEYTLDSQNRHLQDTIDHFAGSFNREGMAVRGGFTAASLLSPIQADPENCKPGETPLDCEFRIHNPSILMISLETWLDPETVDRYEIYLRQIIEASIDRGVLPILANKADMSEVGDGKHYINPAIAKIAYEYDLPMWNFWRAAQHLPNFGIDPEREGFHLSQQGWDMKTLMGLQALDMIWRTVSNQEVVPNSQFTATPTPIQINSPTPESTAIKKANPTPIPICHPDDQGFTSCIIFGLMAQEGSELQSQGIFLFDTNSKQSAQVYETSFNLQAISKDGETLLVNQDNNLYFGSSHQQILDPISNTFYSFGKQNVYWTNDQESLILIDTRDGYNRIWQYQIEEKKWTVLSPEGTEAINLYTSASPDRVYFESGQCTAKDFCQKTGVWNLSISDSTIEALPEIMNPVYSPDNTRVVFVNPNFNKDNIEHLYPYQMRIEELEKPLISRRNIYIPPASGFMVNARLLDYFWSPESTKIFVLADDYSDYYENSIVLRSLVFDIDSGVLLEYDQLYGKYGSLKPQAVWAPDGSFTIIAATNLLDSGDYTLNFYKIQLDPKDLSIVDEKLNLASGNYHYITNLFWVSAIE
ncbi:MAG: hypothetical protein JEZ06_08370 [Anaerolineaceae bacterium]|nr:hypothetical protein [Anaerolineaceae bacterium]